MCERDVSHADGPMKTKTTCQLIYTFISTCIYHCSCGMYVFFIMFRVDYSPLVDRWLGGSQPSHMYHGDLVVGGGSLQSLELNRVPSHFHAFRATSPSPNFIMLTCFVLCLFAYEITALSIQGAWLIIGKSARKSHIVQSCWVCCFSAKHSPFLLWFRSFVIRIMYGSLLQVVLLSAFFTDTKDIM